MTGKFLNKFILAVTMAACTGAWGQETTAPDILLIIGDDLGAEIGCYGDPYAKTPHMDKLAAEGTRFDNAWVTQAGCSPSRGSIMTGLYPHQNGLVGLAHTGFSMDKEFPTIPSLLKDAGYYTGVVGKVNIAPRVPFDFAVEQGSKKLEQRNPKNYAKHVTEFLEKAGDRPIFLNVSFVDPHRPFAAQIKGQPADPVTAEEVKPLPFLPGLEDSEAVKKDTAGYYNGVMRMDEGVGLVMDELKKAGRLDNTVIVLVGDHGAPFTRSKTTCYHSGLRVPFLVKWPGVSKAGTDSKALVSTVDILPTFLDAAGVPAKDLAGVSLRETLKNPDTSPREYLAAEHTAHVPLDYYPRRTIRDDRYQLIHNLLHDQPNPEKGSDQDSAWAAVMDNNEGTSQSRELMERFYNPPQFELYDLQEDPHSFTNLADDPNMAEVKQRLQAALKSWQDETSDTLRTREDALAYLEHVENVIHPRAMENKGYRERMTTLEREIPKMEALKRKQEQKSEN